MTLAELKTILSAAGYPVAYSHFSEAKKPPFVCYLVTDSANFMADDKVYQKINNAQIELYTNKKDLIAEGNLEKVLDDNLIAYDSTEIYIESEKLFQKIYEVSL
jgi:sulfur transfer complex TusBCD TusB component (DsrH family)